MGLQLKGLFGDFLGKNQMDQRYMFGMVTRLLRYISDMVNIVFQEHKVSAFAMNAALAYNFKYAVVGVNANMPQLSCSQGKLIDPGGIAAEALEGG